MPVTPASACRHAAFTLIEMLIVIAVILILMGLLLASVRSLHNQAYKNSALRLVGELSSAFDEYRAEDPRKLYPTPPFANQAGANFLALDPANPLGVLSILQYHSTYTVPASNLDQNPADPYYLCLVDGWKRPFYYQLDGAYMTAAGTQDSHLMNGVADRPVATIGTAAAGIAPTWNSQSVEPFAYLWSTGVPINTPASADTQPSNWQNWIYPATSQ